MTLHQFHSTRVSADSIHRGWSAQPLVRSSYMGRLVTHERSLYLGWLGLHWPSGRRSARSSDRTVPRPWWRVALSVAALIAGMPLWGAASVFAHGWSAASPAWVDSAPVPPPAPSEVSIIHVQAVIPGENMGHGWIRVAMQWQNNAPLNGGYLVERSNCGYCDGIYVPATWTVIRRHGRTHRVGMMHSSDAFLNTPSRAGACYRVEIFNLSRSAWAYSPIIFQQSCVYPDFPQ